MRRSWPIRSVNPRYYASLAADMDEAVVLRLIDGEVPDDGYTSFERREAVRRMTRVGFSQLEVARRLHVDARQVHRDLDHLRKHGSM